MSERDDLLDTLGKHRYLLRHTARDLTDDQARLRPTVSALSIGGIIKHVAGVEQRWATFVVTGRMGSAPDSEAAADDWTQGFVLLADETLAGELERYAEVAARTDDLVRSVDLDVGHPLPPAPWFPPNTHWTARRVFHHLIAETSQHAGHADIIRETIDGQRTMG